MRIGIILYSYSGNSLSVGERLKTALLIKGHEVSIERVKALDEDPQSTKPIILTEIPNISRYDQIILGAPVKKFSLNPIMKEYINKLPDLHDKTFSCFVTEHFPKAWMGGNHAIKQMKRAIHNKNGVITKTGVVNWSNKMREEQISEIIDRFSSC